MSERYRLVQLLGTGGMAEVFLAVAQGEEGFRKPVAVKRVLPHLSRDPRVARMFVAEAQLAMHLHHQNVVEVFDVGRDANGLYVVMELVDGWDLTAVLEALKAKGQSLSPALVGFIADQVVAGLAHAYGQSKDGAPLITAHRDVSPGNVLVSVDGGVKLGDFGIARLGAASGTEPGTFKGKLAYASPESMRGEPVTARADQFALGALLHELLTGALPYGNSELPLQQYQAVMQGPLPALPGVPVPLAEIVRRLVRPDPAERFADADQVAEALGQFLASAGTPANARELSRLLRDLSLPITPNEKLKQAPEPAAPRTIELTLESLDAPFEPAQGLSLDIDGRMRGATTWAPDPAPPAPRVQPLAVLPIANELGSYARPETEPLRRGASTAPVDYLPITDKPPARLWPLIVLSILLLGGSAAFFWVRRSGAEGVRQQLRTLSGAEPAILRIESEPDGATIRISGQVVGETPLFQENLYATGASIPVTLTLKGYRAWTGTFRGGEKVTLQARLHR